MVWADFGRSRVLGVARASRRTGMPRSSPKSLRVSTPLSVKMPAKPTLLSMRRRTKRRQSTCSRIFRTRTRVLPSTKRALPRLSVRIGTRWPRISVPLCRVLRKRWARKLMLYRWRSLTLLSLAWRYHRPGLPYVLALSANCISPVIPQGTPVHACVVSICRAQVP